jgi:Na+/melibiose symporter-like transporter
MTEAPLFCERNFRFLFTASAFTNLGDGILAVALPWAATLMTDNPLLIGLVATARQLPWLLLSLPAGVMTDRFDRRRVILTCDGLRLLLALALVGLMLAGAGGVWALIALTFALGSAEVLRDNTAQTMLPQVVGTARLEKANGLIWTIEQLGGQFLGPPLAGLLIALSIALPFGFQAGMLALALLLIGRMALRPVDRGPRQAFWPALREGMVWLWHHATLRRLAFVLGAFNFFGSMVWAVMVLYGQRVLGLDAAGYGAMLSVLAAGGLAGSLLGPGLIARIGPTAALFLGMAGFGAACLVLAVSSSVILTTIALTIEAFSALIWNIATVSYRQRHIPGPLLGRVNSAYRFFGTGTNPMGAFAGGAIVAAAAPLGQAALHLPYAIAFAGTVGMIAYAAFRLRLE